jgi:hypothetical protein
LCSDDILLIIIADMQDFACWDAGSLEGRFKDPPVGFLPPYDS